MSGLLLSSFLYADDNYVDDYYIYDSYYPDVDDYYTGDSYYYTDNYLAATNQYSPRNPIDYIKSIMYLSECITTCTVCIYNFYDHPEVLEFWLENSKVRPMAHYLQELAYLETFIISYSDICLNQNINHIIYQLETFEFVNDMLFSMFLEQYLLSPIRQVTDITMTLYCHLSQVWKF